jgi:hypothetical protein
MDYINDVPLAIQDRLPEGPALTDWLLAELDRAHAAAVRMHALECEATCRGPEDTLAWTKMMRAFVLKHRAVVTYATNTCDPAGPDVPGGWHCQECGLDRDGPTEDWPCEVLVMVATFLWHAQRPGVPVTWTWTAPEDQLIWARGAPAGEHPRPGTSRSSRSSQPTTARTQTMTRDEHRGGI